MESGIQGSPAFNSSASTAVFRKPSSQKSDSSGTNYPPNKRIFYFGKGPTWGWAKLPYAFKTWSDLRCPACDLMGSYGNPGCPSCCPASFPQGRRLSVLGLGMRGWLVPLSGWASPSTLGEESRTLFLGQRPALGPRPAWWPWVGSAIHTLLEVTLATVTRPCWSFRVYLINDVKHLETQVLDGWSP